MKGRNVAGSSLADVVFRRVTHRTHLRCRRQIVKPAKLEIRMKVIRRRTTEFEDRRYRRKECRRRIGRLRGMNEVDIKLVAVTLSCEQCKTTRNMITLRHIERWSIAIQLAHKLLTPEDIRCTTVNVQRKGMFDASRNHHTARNAEFPNSMRTAC